MRGSLRKRGTNYYAIIELPREADGKRRQKEISLKTSSKQEADKKIAALLHEVHGGTYVDATKQTVSGFLNEYHENVSKLKLRPNAYNREAQIIRNQLVPNIGHHKLSMLQPGHIQAMYAELGQTGSAKGGKLSARSVEYAHAVLHVALKHAVRTGLLAVNPADRVQKPKVHRAETETITLEQFRKLLDTVRHTVDYIPILLAGTCGLRASEILALRWLDVDLERGTLTIQRILSQVGAELEFTEPKTEKSRRTIPIPSFAVEELKAHKAAQDEHRKQFGEKYNPEGVVCPDRRGDYRKPKSFAGAVRDTIDRAKLNIRFHDLRHTHASILLSQGVNMKEIQERLGHSNLSTTMNIYLHSAPNMQEEAVKRFDEAFRTPNGNNGATDEGSVGKEE